MFENSPELKSKRTGNPLPELSGRSVTVSLKLALSIVLVLTLALSLALPFGGGAARAAGLQDFSSQSPVPASFPVSSPVLSKARPLAGPVGVAGGSAFHFSGRRPATLGAAEGRLTDCPQTPNCVSSQAGDDLHQIAALDYGEADVSAQQAMQVLKQIIDDSERAEVLRADEGYLYAEFTSRLMGFVDDVEFLFAPDRSRIDVRSASRLGESDLGVNRKRVERIRSQFQALLKTLE